MSNIEQKNCSTLVRNIYVNCILDSTIFIPDVTLKASSLFDLKRKQKTSADIWCLVLGF